MKIKMPILIIGIFYHTVHNKLYPREQMRFILQKYKRDAGTLNGYMRYL